MTTLAKNLASIARFFLTDIIAANGKFTLPNGLIVQFGTATISASSSASGNQNVSFPAPFPNNVLAVLPCAQNVATPVKGVGWGWTPVDLTQFSLRWSVVTAGDFSGGTALTYLAIGN